MVLLSIAGQADPAGHIHGVGSKLQLQSARAVLQNLDGVGVPRGAGIHVAGHHGGNHVDGIHLIGLDVVHSQAGSVQSAGQSGLRGGTAVVGNLLALQLGDVIHRGNTGGGQDNDAVGAVDGRGHEDVGLTVDAQLVGAMADVGQINAAAFHSRDLFGAGSELPQGNLQAFFGEEALIHSGEDGPQGSVVGHIGDIQFDGFHRCFGGSLGGSLSSGLGGFGGGSGGCGGGGFRRGRSAGSQTKDHHNSQQQGKQLFHYFSS